MCSEQVPEPLPAGVPERPPASLVEEAEGEGGEGGDGSGGGGGGGGGGEPAAKRPNRALSTSDKIAEAQRFKTEGNALFQQGKNKRAIAMYMRVFAYTNGLAVAEELSQYQQALGQRPPTAAESEEIAQLQLSTNSNMAMCHLKLQQPRPALEKCEKVLAVVPDHVKATFNKGRAWMLLNDLDKAQAALERAATLAPGDKNVQRELVKLGKLREKERAKEKTTWQAAFNKM